MNTAHLHVLRSLPCCFATPRSIFRRGPAAGCSRRGPPCGPARAGAAGGSRPRRRSARRTRSPRRARRRRRRRRGAASRRRRSFRSPPRATRRRVARAFARLGGVRSFRASRRDVRPRFTDYVRNRTIRGILPAHASPRGLARHAQRFRGALVFFAEPLAHVPARVPKHPEPHVGGVHGGGRAGRWTRRRVRASRKTSRRLLRRRFPGPDASPRGARRGSHREASEGWITPPDVNRVVIPSPDRKTSPGGPEPFPKSTHDLHRTSPPREEHPGAPRPGVAKPASCEAAVLKKRACFDFRGKLQVYVSFPKKKIWCAPRALRTRVARERTRGGHSPETSRRKDELERDMQVFPARRLPQRRVVSVQPRDVRPEIDGMHVLPRGELRVRG